MGSLERPQQQKETPDKANLWKLSPAAMAFLATLITGSPVGAQGQQQELDHQPKIEQSQPHDEAREGFVKMFGEEKTKKIETEARRKVYQEYVIPELLKIQEQLKKATEELNK